MTRIVPLLVSIAILGACSVDETANPAPRCNPDGSCPMDLLCYRGFCVPGGVECDEEGMVVDCYTGTEGTAGIGVCRPGTRECRQGVWTACLGQVVDGIETCNGEDDDCDGRTDEFDDPSCDTGESGACGPGTLVCRGMTATCERIADPEPEVCDGDDEDCDDAIDEDTDVRCYPKGETGCTAVGDGTFSCMGICNAGDQTCADGALSACTGAVVPTPGLDDCTTGGGTAADDDCDGMTDEDCACSLGATQSCYGGPMGTEGVGECRMGTQTCTEITPGTNRFGACVGEVVPTAETCANDAGTDDDCNGTVDDIPTRGDPCTDMTAMGVCRNGFRDCMAGAISCITPAPTTEICNGLDDDCNGTVDNGFDLLTDEMNCGMCGNVCGMGLTCCSGACVNVQAEPTHCGTCGNDCGADVDCCSGVCADLDIDEMHCGTCGSPCGAAVQQCCAGGCIDPRQNEMHCGGCGIACAASEQCCLNTCVDPTDPSCDVCLENCAAMGLECCDGSCLDTSNDTLNCGGCGVTCAGGELCCSGSCVPSDVANCGMCGRACMSGNLCCAGTCVPNDSANCGTCGVTCSVGDCCSSMCVDTRTNPNHCGTCGMMCSAGETCQAGACCGSGLTGCAGACFDLDTAQQHCGQCGFACRGNETCIMGCCVRNGSPSMMRCP